MTKNQILTAFNRKRERIMASHIIDPNSTDKRQIINILTEITNSSLRGEYQVYYILDINDMFKICEIDPKIINAIDPDVINGIKRFYWHGTTEDLNNGVGIGRRGIAFT